MTNKGKVITAIIVVAVVLAGGAGFYFKGGDLMGKMFSKEVSKTLQVKQPGLQATKDGFTGKISLLTTKDDLLIENIVIRPHPLSKLLLAKIEWLESGEKYSRVAYSEGGLVEFDSIYGDLVVNKGEKTEVTLLLNWDSSVTGEKSYKVMKIEGVWLPGGEVFEESY